MKRLLAVVGLLFVATSVHGVTTNVQTRPSGTSGAVQFNNGGVFGSSPTFTYDKINNDLSVSSVSVTFIDGSTATLRLIRWSDGTLQTTAAGSGSYVVLGTTLQSGTFCVSSGTVNALNVLTINGSPYPPAGSGGGGGFWVQPATSPLNMAGFAIFGSSFVATSSFTVTGGTETHNGVTYNLPSLAQFTTNQQLIVFTKSGGNIIGTPSNVILDGMRTGSTDTVSGAKVFQSSVTLPTTTQVTSVDATGEIAVQTNAYTTHGSSSTLVFYADGKKYYVVATTGVPVDNFIPKWDSALNQWSVEVDSGSTGGGGSGTPGGSDTQFQFNSASSFGGVSVATFNSTTNQVTFSSAFVHVNISSEILNNVNLVLSGTSGLNTGSSFGTSGQVLTSGGTGVAPSWSSVSGMSPGASYYAQISPTATQSGGINVTSIAGNSLTISTTTGSGVGSFAGEAFDYNSFSPQLVVIATGSASFGKGPHFGMSHYESGNLVTDFGIIARQEDASNTGIRFMNRFGGTPSIAWELLYDGISNFHLNIPTYKLSLGSSEQLIYEYSGGDGLIVDPHVDSIGTKRRLIIGSGTSSTMYELAFDGSSADGSLVFVSTVAGGGQFMMRNPWLFQSSATVASQLQTNTLKVVGLPGAGPLYADASGLVSTTTASSSGSSASSLAVTTGSATGFTAMVSSPTSIILLSSDTFIVSLKANTTAFVTLNASSVTLMGPNVQPLDSDLTAVAALSSNGLVARTGTGTMSARTLTSNNTDFVVTNGDGVSGNPVLNISSSVVIQAGGKLPALDGSNLTGLSSGSGPFTIAVATTNISGGGYTLSNVVISATATATMASVNLTTNSITNLLFESWGDGGAGWTTYPSSTAYLTVDTAIGASTWTIPGMSFQLVKNSTYVFTGFFVFSSPSSVATGVKFAANYTGASTQDFSLRIGAAGTTSASAGNFAGTTGTLNTPTSTALGVATSQTWTVPFVAHMVTGTSNGTFYFQSVSVSGGAYTFRAYDTFAHGMKMP